MLKQIKIYHRIWNEHNPNNRIEKGDGNVIHHKDENPKNNSIKNLKKMTDKKHRTLHHKGKKVSQETRNKISKIQKESSYFPFI